MISLTNVRLIFAREVRDQLRDRRTLFMIFVLPLVLYPLLGTAYLRLSQFRTEKPMSVLVIGAGGNHGDTPSLFDVESGKHLAGTKGRFSPQLFSDGEKGSNRLLLDFPGDNGQAMEREAIEGVESHRYDAALVFPPDFAKKLADYRKAIIDHAAKHHAHASTEASSDIEIPKPQVISTTANERSQLAAQRLRFVLDRWTEEVGKTNLASVGMPASAVRPFDLENVDLSEKTSLHGAGVWSSLLPVLLLLWALTGAFYPSIDLCAGEKERGTLETLLSSPAQRTEIVLGKLLTIMLVSITTSALNLVSVSMTGCMVLRMAGNFVSPPLWAVVWLPLALLPMSALFSALCLALAAFARSTREGQYYLMPLLLVVMPLAMLPMSGGVELNVGNALLPVAGVALLLKTLLEGSYMQALPYIPIVLAVTFASCWLSVRWAVEQFTSESVLFREGERFQPGLWLRHLMRDRQPIPSPAEGLVCAVTILLLSFVLTSAISPPPDLAGFIRVALVTQLAVILTPVLLMSVVLTSSPRKTLLLRLPKLSVFVSAGILAVVLHPFVVLFSNFVNQVYPIPPDVESVMQEFMKLLGGAPTWELLLVVAAAPALCEELAFRGFILSGFRSTGNKARAIVLSALFFGLSHAFLQQSIITFVVGLVLAYLAVQSESILPGMLFHFTHNALSVVDIGAASRLVQDYLESHDMGVLYRVLNNLLGMLGFHRDEPLTLMAYLVCGFIAAVVFAWLALQSHWRNTGPLALDSGPASSEPHGAYTA
jgi:sodium transport system permease protein